MNGPRLSAKLSLAPLSAALLGLYSPGGAHAQDNALEEIFVTGSRISRQGFDAPTPVTSIDNSYLMDLGFVNVGAAVQQLPTNKASLTPETNGFGSFNVGAQIANLRALGAARTLTLVDGRRHIASTDTGNVDLNLIPPLLLDRTEIVTGGASAAYGSDAVAGVINVILDKDLEGVRWQADMYQSAEGDGQSQHVSAGGGVSLFGGRGHLIIGGEYEDAEGVDSCIFTRDWCRDLPGIVTNTPGATAIPGAPRNIISNDVVLGNMTSAGMIVGGQTALPTTSRLYGIQFDANGNPIPFNYGAPREAQFQIGGDGFSRYETTNPRTPVERASLYTHLSYDVTDATTMFFELSYGMAEGHNLGAARWFNGAQAITINRGNPFIPAPILSLMDGDLGTTADDINSFRLGKHWDDWGRVESHSDNQVYRMVVGAEGEIDDTWSWDAYYQLAYDDRHQYLLRQPINANFTRALNAVAGPNGQPTCADLLNPNPAIASAAAGCVAINPFGLNRWDPAARDYVLGTLHEWYKMNEYVIAANVQGEIFEVGGGPIGVAAGFETRRDNGAVTHDPCSRSSCYWQNFGDDFAGKLKVMEAYGEAAIPFIRDKRGAELFELDVALRQTHYRNEQPGHYEYYNNGTIIYVGDRSSTIDATTYKFSALYDPTEWLRLRATRSRDIRAPNFSELYERTESVGFAGQVNPWTGNTDLPLVANTGNVDVAEEKGDTETYGLVFSPNWSWGEGFRLSLDWWTIEIHDAIARVGTMAGTGIVDQCFAGNDFLCDFIEGEGPGGVITHISNTFLNLDVYATKGVDLEALYQMDLDSGSTLGFRFFATRTDEVITTLAGVKTDQAGVTGPNAFGQPKYAFNGTVSYDRERWGVSFQTRYIDDGLYNATWLDPTQPGYNPASALSVNDNTIDSWTSATVSGRYRLPMNSDRSWELFMTINNAFDEDPPLAPDGAYPTNAAFYDQIGRAYRVGIQADF
jgi:outer membrane receptor protein involved in Fe transport